MQYHVVLYFQFQFGLHFRFVVVDFVLSVCLLHLPVLYYLVHFVSPTSYKTFTSDSSKVFENS